MHRLGSDHAHRILRLGGARLSALSLLGVAAPLSCGSSSVAVLAGPEDGGAGGCAANGASGSGGGTGGATADAGGGAGLHYYVSPNGSGTACPSANCSRAMPCTITRAQAVVRAAAPSMKGDMVVELADGTYTLTTPLVFSGADSGANGYTIAWQAATGAHPVLSGAQRITGWTVSDSSKNIWKASAPSTFAARQLFVDGEIAIRARQQINRSDLTFTSTGFQFSDASLDFLNSAAQQERIDLHAIGSWTDRYSPVQSIANNTATMVQPAWANNSWGYDTIPDSNRPSNVYVENAYELLDQPGEWYLDTSAGALYYEPLANQDMSTADVELPQVQVLVAVTGTYDQPAHDLTFGGLTFSYTSWLGPSSSDGYACQQTGTYIQGSGYPAFEATRPNWYQMPAAVQVSAAKNISFQSDNFVALGEVGLGIGNDDDAHVTNVGLGADTINVIGCVFTQIAGGGIMIGGVQANAHHPSDPRMVNRNITISDNLVHDVAIDYRDGAGILFTYTNNVVVSHNEVYNIPYSGINAGFGWGTNDEGGSQDYVNRGLYDYQPIYTTPTTAQNNQVVANLVHDGMQQMDEGGCLYFLSANPGTVVTQNYCVGPWPASSYGTYANEGSRYLTFTQNVFGGWGAWGAENANSTNETGNLTIANNWLSGGAVGISDGSRTCPALGTLVSTWTPGDCGDVVTGNTSIGAGALPADAQTVVNAAGLEPAYAGLKRSP